MEVKKTLVVTLFALTLSACGDPMMFQYADGDEAADEILDAPVDAPQGTEVLNPGDKPTQVERGEGEDLPSVDGPETEGDFIRQDNGLNPRSRTPFDDKSEFDRVYAPPAAPQGQTPREIEIPEIIR